MDDQEAEDIQSSKIMTPCHFLALSHTLDQEPND